MFVDGHRSQVTGHGHGDKAVTPNLTDTPVASDNPKDALRIDPNMGERRVRGENRGHATALPVPLDPQQSPIGVDGDHPAVGPFGQRHQRGHMPVGVAHRALPD